MGWELGAYKQWEFISYSSGNWVFKIMMLVLPGSQRAAVQNKLLPMAPPPNTILLRIKISTQECQEDTSNLVAATPLAM